MIYSQCMFDDTPSPIIYTFDTPTKTLSTGLQTFTYPKDNPNTKTLYIGVDEVGRGALISRVYTAACILPDPEDVPTTTLDFTQLRDSKKIPHKHIVSLAETIKAGAIAYAIAWEDEATIDRINILQATQSAMHKAITAILSQIPEDQQVHLLIDGNYFNPIMRSGRQIPYTTIEGGDNAFCVIAAASILAKNARDSYIQNDLCVEHPELDMQYALKGNVGYGSSRHLDGIRAYGISPWHRRTFGICKRYVNIADAPPLDISLRAILAQKDAADAAAKAPKPRKVKAPKVKTEPKVKTRGVITNPTLAGLEATITDFMTQIQDEISAMLSAHYALKEDDVEEIEKL